MKRAEIVKNTEKQILELRSKGIADVDIFENVDEYKAGWTKEHEDFSYMFEQACMNLGLI